MATDFAESLSVSLTRRKHVDEDSSWPVLLAELAAAAGSKAAAARVLGVSPTTFYRWVSGRSSRPGRPAQQPKIPKATVVKAIRARQLDDSVAQRIRTKRLTMWIKGMVVVSNDARPRTIHCGREFPAQLQGDILDAWLDGQDSRAENMTWDGIDTHYAPGMYVESVDAIGWEKNSA